MEAYVDLYLAELTAILLKKGEKKLPADFKAHFDLVWLDYARVILTGLWKRLTHEQIRRYANAVGFLFIFIFICSFNAYFLASRNIKDCFL